ncbi:cysteine-rich motor neuron 1 protein-like [Discoglossus pictus]
MRFGYTLLVIFSCIIQVLAAYNCTRCDKQKCPPLSTSCLGHVAIDPCGCCEHCSKKEWEPCGGENWQIGYCDKNIQCVSTIGEELVEPPMVGICKSMPDVPYINHWEDDDVNCPLQSGCYVTTGVCDCVTKRTCIIDFSYSTYEQCNKRLDEDYAYKPYKPVCFNRGCDIVNRRCVCSTGNCERKYEYSDYNQCNKALVNQICANVTCPVLDKVKCPGDSLATETYTPPGECCPTVHSVCTCDFTRCNNDCPKRKRKVMIKKTDGIPGSCCDRFLCLW